jgi:hypothetical protein
MWGMPSMFVALLVLMIIGSIILAALLLVLV